MQQLIHVYMGVPLKLVLNTHKTPHVFMCVCGIPTKICDRWTVVKISDAQCKNL